MNVVSFKDGRIKNIDFSLRSDVKVTITGPILLILMEQPSRKKTNLNLGPPGKTLLLLHY